MFGQKPRFITRNIARITRELMIFQYQLERQADAEARHSVYNMDAELKELYPGIFRWLRGKKKKMKIKL